VPIFLQYQKIAILATKNLVDRGKADVITSIGISPKLKRPRIGEVAAMGRCATSVRRRDVQGMQMIALLP
jgi:hypothetical protein